MYIKTLYTYIYENVINKVNHKPKGNTKETYY